MRRAARVDNSAKPLIAYAKSLGFDYLPINGVIDGVLAWGRKSVVVDWKSAGGDLTPAQTKLIARGFPVFCISTPAQLDALKLEISK